MGNRAMKKKMTWQWLFGFGFTICVLLNSYGQTASDSDAVKRKIKAQGAKWAGLQLVIPKVIICGLA